MNSNSLQYRDDENSAQLIALIRPVSIIARTTSIISALLERRKIANARWKYQTLQQQKDKMQGDILNTLPITEKQRLGMHRYMK